MICKQVLEPLKKSPLAGLPIWAGEYKAWYQSLPESDVKDFKKDFQLLHGWLGSATCGGDGVEMRGVSIFEFQVSYYKGPGDHQMSFGIFELGSRQPFGVLSAMCGRSEDRLDQEGRRDPMEGLPGVVPPATSQQQGAKLGFRCRGGLWGPRA